MYPAKDLISSLNVSVYRIPTGYPESDGTLSWESTTMILVEIEAAGKTGLGYTYGHHSIAELINRDLKELVIGRSCFHIESITSSMIEHVRNNGMCGIAMMAVSAVDISLWDLKAKLFGVPLAVLLGMVHKDVLVYGSGGFTSYSTGQIEQQFTNWVSYGIKSFKMKVGRKPEEDTNRVKAARSSIGPGRFLFVDANGAYTVRQALQKAEEFHESGVTWFEEPVSSDNLKGLSFLREHVPPEMNLTAGEYGYNLPYFARMIEEKSVDILQADATRCGGITGFLKVGYLCEAHQIPFSSHCAPAIHYQAALSLPSFFIAEYFHDHVRIEEEFFEGVPVPANGALTPDPDRPGLGLELKKQDVEKYRE